MLCVEKGERARDHAMNTHNRNGASR